MVDATDAKADFEPEHQIGFLLYILVGGAGIALAESRRIAQRRAEEIAQAVTALEGFTPDEVNGWADKDLDFQIGPRRLAFTPATFILSFSLPNFHFHAVTAYDILRTRGVPLGKRDYEGQLRTKPA